MSIIPIIDLTSKEIDRSLVNLIPLKVLKKHCVVPISRRGATITVATADPSNIFAVDELKFITGYNIEMVVAKKADIQHVLGIDPDAAEVTDITTFTGLTKSGGKRSADPDATTDFEDMGEDSEANMEDFFDFAEEDGELGFASEDGDGPETMPELEDFGSLVSGAIDDVEVVEGEEDDPLSQNVDAPIIKLVNGILLKAIQMKVSDIHIEPFEKMVRVRYRVDGVLKKIMTLPNKIKNPVLSRLKIMAHLDIAERRLPQDGRIKLKIGKNREMDFRVSSLPTIFGEKMVMRLLDKSNLQLDMTKLGFEEKSMADFQHAIVQPWGMCW